MASSDPLTEVSEEIFRLLFDAHGEDTAVERPIEADSQLASEVRETTHDAARHFLNQLAQHCTMLAIAIADALQTLAKLDPNLPFSGTVVTRALFEAAADLYWLSDNGIDRVERTRRTFIVFLRQRESQVRQLEHAAERDPSYAPGGVDTSEAIAEGWELLKSEAEEMASAGYELRTSRRVGSAYSLGDPKPSIGTLVDVVLSDYLGKTRVPLYALYSSVAHAEGEGLGSLLALDDTIETTEGARYRHGFDSEEWKQRIVLPATRVARGAVTTWAKLAHPVRLGADR